MNVEHCMTMTGVVSDYCEVSPAAQHFVENLLRIEPAERLSSPANSRY